MDKYAKPIILCLNYKGMFTQQIFPSEKSVTESTAEIQGGILLQWRFSWMFCTPISLNSMGITHVLSAQSRIRRDSTLKK